MKKIFTLLCLMALSLSALADTFNIYIKNETGWAENALYAWADGRSDILGAWPGMQATGSEGEYLVFTVDESVVPANLIFNNNNNGSQVEGVSITEAADIHLVATATSLTVEGAPAPVYTNYIYVEDQTGWEVLKMYAYDDGRTTILGSWPGKDADDSQVIDGVTYKVYGVPEDFAPANIILNNNAGTQLADFYIGEQKDYYLLATTAGVVEQGGELPEYDTYHIYATDNTGWTAFNLYAWGTYEAFGAWPGIAATEFEFQVVKNGSIELHLIFHQDDEEANRALFDITEARDYHLVVTAESVSEVQAAIDLIENGNEQCTKRIQNGQLVIIRDGKTFNTLGTELR